MKDVLGQALDVGDLVAYAALNYKRALLRTGEVVAIDEGRRDGVRVKGDHDGTRRWMTPNTVVLL